MTRHRLIPNRTFISVRGFIFRITTPAYRAPFSLGRTAQETKDRACAAHTIPHFAEVTVGPHKRSLEEITRRKPDRFWNIPT